MLDKLKLRKAPISLSSVSNHIKSSGNVDLLPELHAKELNIQNVIQYGLKENAIIAVAFDPVQSLLAVSTTNNEVRVMGQSTVEVVFEFNSPKPIVQLKFIKGIYLVAILETSNITVLSLHSKQILSNYLPPGSVSSVELDPSLDWLIVGLTNGNLVFYDVDRFNLAPLRLDNLQKKVLPKEKLSPALHIEWHPRDIGCLLVTYSHCSILFSITTGEIRQAFIYKLPKGCKGFDWALNVANKGKKKMFLNPKEVIPELIESHFHPNGLHLVTVHVDNSLVFWDAVTGALLEARNIFDINLHKQGVAAATPDTMSLQNYLPIQSVKWVCSADPEATKLLVCGGDFANPNRVYILDFGITLKYSMTSYEKQGEFYSRPSNGQKYLAVNFYHNKTSDFEFIEKIIPLAQDGSPYFNGCHNPNYIIFKSNLHKIYIVAFGDMITNNFQDLGKLLLPPSIAFVHPPVTFSNVELIKRIDWYSVQSNRISSGVQAKTELLLKGGAAVNEHLIRSMGYNDGYRKILVTGHEGGIIRLFDISRGEVGEQEGLIQISLQETLVVNHIDDLTIVSVSCAFEGRDLVVGLANGNVVLCKFGKMNTGRAPLPPDYSNCPVQHSNGNAKILNIRNRIRGSFANSSTFLPVSLMALDVPDTISCLKCCNIGFSATAYKSGRLIVCDVGRGPAVIYNIESVGQLVPTSPECHVTSIEFSIMEYGQEGYSSILMICGTNDGGNLLYFKILPQPSGGFEVVFADKTMKLNYKSNEDSCIKQIIPVSVKGELSTPTLEVFHKLSQGILIPGYVVLASDKDIRVLKPPKQKLSHKVIDEYCSCMGVIDVSTRGIVLGSVLRTGFIKFSTLPALSDITDYKLSKDLLKSYDLNTLSKSNILKTGDIYIRTGESEFINLAVILKDPKKKSLKSDIGSSVDLLFNENSCIPPRPVVSALQWATGASRITTTDDLNMLVGGPNRKPAKHPESRLAYNISPEANPTQGYGTGSSGGSVSGASGMGDGDMGDGGRGYKEPIRRAGGSGGVLNRTSGQPGFMRSIQTGIESVEESINGYASNIGEAMNDTVEGQKKEMYSSAFKSKFGF